jgi:hypothetical protein
MFKIYTIHPKAIQCQISMQQSPLILKGVKSGKTFVTWGNLDEKLLNRVISVKNVKVEGTKWNLLLNLLHV